MLDRLSLALARVRFPDGSAAFAPRAPTEAERAQGADLAVPTQARQLWDRLEFDRRVVEGAILPVARLTGTHDQHTPGILVASGPLFAAGARPRKIHIHDLAPTVLVALGLPVADDFAGRARLELFAPRLRRRQPGAEDRDLGREPAWRAADVAARPRAARRARGTRIPRVGKIQRSKSSATSSAGALWVIQPTEIRSTPVSATARIVSRVMPPEASSSTRPRAAATAHRAIAARSKLSSITTSAPAAIASSSWPRRLDLGLDLDQVAGVRAGATHRLADRARRSRRGCP